MELARRPRSRAWQSAIGLLLLLTSVHVNASDFMPETPIPGYDHDRFVTWHRAIVVNTTPFMASFDSEDDGISLGVPEFVAYEMRRYGSSLKKSPKRPSPWITDKAMYQAGIAPGDASYKYSRAFRNNNPNWYDRGHLCAQVHAWRLGRAASWNTHTVFNAVPQRHAFNAGIWKNLEEHTAQWAEEYGRIWVITGPIFLSDPPEEFIGEAAKGEMRVAVPDALFKIVIREEDEDIEVLGFIYPQLGVGLKKGPFDHAPYLHSVDEIEAQTGLNFLSVFPESLQTQLEAVAATQLWP